MPTLQGKRPSELRAEFDAWVDQLTRLTERTREQFRSSSCFYWLRGTEVRLAFDAWNMSKEPPPPTDFKVMLQMSREHLAQGFEPFSLEALQAFVAAALEDPGNYPMSNKHLAWSRPLPREKGQLQYQIPVKQQDEGLIR